MAGIRACATAVKAVALDEPLLRDELNDKLCARADRALDVRPPSRRSLVGAHLMAKRRQARAMFAKMVLLPFEAQTAHPVTDALQVLRGLYARKAYTLPDRVTIRLGRAWREAIDGYDRHKALSAFEWATLFALRIALGNGSVYVEHSFAFRSQARMLIPQRLEFRSQPLLRSSQTAARCEGIPRTVDQASRSGACRAARRDGARRCADRYRGTSRPLIGARQGCCAGAVALCDLRFPPGWPATRDHPRNSHPDTLHL